MRADTVAALSTKLTNLDHIDEVIGELEDRQRWLVQYIDLKNKEHDTTRLQSNLQLAHVLKQINRVLEEIEQSKPRFETVCLKINNCTDRLYQLDQEKRACQKLIGELERVQVLRQAVGRLELALFDGRQFGAAVDAIKMVEELQNNLKDSEAAQVWIEKARVTVPLVRKAAMDAIKNIFRSSTESTENCGLVCKSASRVIATDGEEEKRMVEWMAAFYLADYCAVYCNPQSTESELAGLESMESRLGWLTRILNQVDQVVNSKILPSHWRIHAAVIDRFAQVTRRSISRAIDLEQHRSPQNLPSALKTAINSAASYERHLQVSRPQIASTTDFFFLMPAFEAHLGVFIDVHEQILSRFIQNLLKEANSAGKRKWISSKKFTIIPHDDRHVAQSAEELTCLFKNGLAEVAKLTTGAILGGLAEIFQSALRDYAKYILIQVERIHGKQYIILLYYTGRVKCEGSRVESACILINTIDYLLETVSGMEATFRKVLGKVSRVQIDFSGNVTAKVLCASTADVWVELANSEMGKLSAVHDQSTYVSMLIGELVGPPFAQIRRLITFPERHRWVCEAVVANLLAKFESTVRDCRPINSVAAEQFLIDLQTLRPVITSLHAQDAAFQVHADRMITGVERTFKILLHDARDPDSFVTHYYLMSDGDGREEVFRRVLELKGIARDGMTAVAGTTVGRERYLEAFRKHQPPPPAATLPASDKRSMRFRFANLFT